jgi:hypothetical protein
VPCQYLTLLSVRVQACVFIEVDSERLVDVNPRLARSTW